MKLAVIVNLFDGEELLEGALSQLRSHAEEIIVVWQNISNNGEEYYDVEKTVDRLHQNGMVDTVSKYYPDLQITSRQNELKKRVIGVDLAKRKNTHFLFLDADEYYDSVQFSDAKQRIEKGNYDSSFCRLLTYYKEPIYQLQPIEGVHVPFIHKLTEFTVIGKKKFHRKHKLPVDPTRAIFPIGKSLTFAESELVMHHYSFVRKDISRKLRNSSAREDHDFDIEELVRTFHMFDPRNNFDNIILKTGHHTETVPNRFGISI